MEEECDILKMVPSDDQPMDLSQTPNRKLRKAMPPLIPIGLLRSRLQNTKLLNNEVASKSDVSLLSSCLSNNIIVECDPKNVSLHEENIVNVPDAEWMTDSALNVHHRMIYHDNETVIDNSDYNNYGHDDHFKVGHQNHSFEYSSDIDRLSRKRGHLNDDEETEWAAKRLDRARSVPHLTPLVVPLQRQKSLSESRISFSNNFQRHLSPTHVNESLLSNNASESLLHQKWQQQLQHLSTGGENSNSICDSPLMYIEYYSKLLKQFKTQELLHGLSLQPTSVQQSALNNEMVSDSVIVSDGKAIPVEDSSSDSKKRSSRPLTGKHVRSGTGASPATLLSLRRKIEARRQQQQ